MTLYDEIFSQELKFCDGNKIAANARTLTFLAAVRKRVKGMKSVYIGNHPVGIIGGQYILKDAVLKELEGK